MKITTSLKKNYEFKRLYNKGKSAASQHVAVYCRQNGRNENRLGITVSTKLGGAVVRNRIRRRLKEIYRLNEQNLSCGLDIVIVARMKSRFSDYHEIEASVISLFRKLKVVVDSGPGGVA
ncbi:MAG: ribonuclease P protein component [Oscillospiraceae bacterium]|nr:ribonuclease P protein component [Oscillospiraceae bacterium]